MTSLLPPFAAQLEPPPPSHIPWFLSSVTSQAASPLLRQLQVSEAQQLHLKVEGGIFSVLKRILVSITPGHLISLLQSKLGNSNLP